MEPCPSTFALDDIEIHGGILAAGIARHCEECDRCRTRHAQRSELARRFDSALARPLWSRIDVARPRQSPRWWKRLRVAAPVLVGAAALAVFAGRQPEAYRATKGDLAVEIAARRGQAVFPVGPATEVSPGDELQFTVRSGQAGSGRYVLIGSVDGTGKFSAFYPATVEGRSVPLPPAGAPLTPPVVLDDEPGPERIVVVLSERPVEARVLVRLVESGASGQDLAGALGGGVATTQWIVLAKRRPARAQP